MTIRFAEASDAQRITEINIISWEDTYRGLMPDEILDNRTMNENRVIYCQEKILSNDYVILVCETKDKEIAGYIWAGKSRDIDIELFHELYAFYIDPKFQGNGYGTELLKAYKKQINNENFYLYMLKGSRTHDFYIKMGGLEIKDYSKSVIINEHKVEEVLYKF